MKHIHFFHLIQYLSSRGPAENFPKGQHWTLEGLLSTHFRHLPPAAFILLFTQYSRTMIHLTLTSDFVWTRFLSKQIKSDRWWRVRNCLPFVLRFCTYCIEFRAMNTISGLKLDTKWRTISHSQWLSQW